LVTIHTEDTFGDDDDPVMGSMMFLQQSFQLRQVIVAVSDAFGCRKADTVNQAGVNKFVGKYQGVCIADSG
jgi:hypothetical protein